MKYLHLLHDSGSQDYFLRSIKNNPNHKVLVFTHSNSLRYIQELKEIEIVTQNHKDFIDKLDINKFDKVFIHYLSPTFAYFVNKHKHKHKSNFYWAFWGGDGYSLDILPELYSNKTKQIIKSFTNDNDLKSKLIQILKTFNLWSLYRLIKPVDYIESDKKMMIRALENIDFCLTTISGDYDLLIKKYPNLKLKLSPFFYLPVNDKPKIAINKKLNNNNKVNVLLGNSANHTNNHIDVLLKLERYKSQINHIICPLSYSGGKEYIKVIKAKGLDMFAHKFIAIDDFIPKTEWEKELENIDIVFFNHFRQQGFGNIVHLLMNGKKIYLNSKNTIYQFLKSKGCYIFDIENDDISFETLTNEEIKNNQEIIINEFSNTRFDEYCKNLFN